MESDLNAALERISSLYDKWLLAENNQVRSNTEDSIIRIISNRNYIPVDIYMEANNGMGSGLCQPGFFEDDLRRLISIVENRLNCS